MQLDLLGSYFSMANFISSQSKLSNVIHLFYLYYYYWLTYGVSCINKNILIRMVYRWKLRMWKNFTKPPIEDRYRIFFIHFTLCLTSFSTTSHVSQIFVKCSKKQWCRRKLQHLLLRVVVVRDYLFVEPAVSNDKKGYVPAGKSQVICPSKSPHSIMYVYNNIIVSVFIFRTLTHSTLLDDRDSCE